MVGGGSSTRHEKRTIGLLIRHGPTPGDERASEVDDEGPFSFWKLIVASVLLYDSQLRRISLLYLVYCGCA